MGKLYRDLVRMHSKARGSARAVLNVLADYATDEGLAWPGREVIASDAGMSERNVIRCLQALCEQERLSVESNKAGGRGNRPVYKIWFPELGQPAPLLDAPAEKRVTSWHPLDTDGATPIKGDKLSQRATDCHPLDAERVTNARIKGDKSVAILSHARSEPQEPINEPMGESARPPAVIPSGVDGAKLIKISSPHLDPRHFVNGFVPPGKGTTAVEVYYERFSINRDDHRLSNPHEDDLILHCKDLALLREVIIAYHQSPHRARNIKLILDWYHDPSRFRKDHHGHNGNGTTHYQPPPTATFSQREWDDYRDPRAEEIPY